MSDKNLSVADEFDALLNDAMLDFGGTGFGADVRQAELEWDGRVARFRARLVEVAAERDMLRGLVKESIEYADDVITWASRWTPEYVSKASFYIDRAEAATRTVTHE